MEVPHPYVITYVREIEMITDLLLLLLFGWWNGDTEKLDNMSCFKVTANQFQLKFEDPSFLVR